MSICENKYAAADKTLDTILTEKVKSKVKKAVKEKECCGKCEKGKLKKKVVKENLDGAPRMVPIQSLPTGEYFKRKPDSKRVFVRGKWNPMARTYNCSAADDMNQEFNVKKDSLVFTDFEY